MRLRHSGSWFLAGLLLLTAHRAVFASGRSPQSDSSPPALIALPSSTDAPAGAAVRRLSIDDAVKLALDQNLAIQVERFNPQIEDLSVALARSSWTPVAASTFSQNNVDSPASSFLSGGQTAVSDHLFQTNVGLSQNLPWGGATYGFGWESSRLTTTNLFTNFEPTLRSNLTFQFVQPLLRNFKIDGLRQQFLVSKKNREMSDIDLQQTVVDTVRRVKNAYWEYVYSIAALETQRQSLGLARESLRNNRSRVEIGTMAPIDIVEAEAEVARREEAVIVGETAIALAEDQLRALILDPAAPDFWNVELEPTDGPPADMQTVDINMAVRNALDKRTDLRQGRKTLETSEINIRYFRNQTLPDLNAQVDYGLSGLGGTELVRGDGFPGPVIGTVDRGFGSVLGDLFQNRFPAWTVAVTIGYPLGVSTAEAGLARSRLQYSQAQTQLRQLQLQVATEVREAGRLVNTNLKRVEAGRAARQLAQRRLEAEEKKFAAGMSTSFFVFQAQRDLTQARNDELRAILDYSRSLTDFETVQETSLVGTRVVVTTAGSGTLTGSNGSGATGNAQGGNSQAFGLFNR